LCGPPAAAPPAQVYTGNQAWWSAHTARSVLSEKFGSIIGQSPMRYLREWRLLLAGNALADTTMPNRRIAKEAGYDTVAAFSREFSRLHGVPRRRDGAHRHAANAT
jgi:AraC-like DNA-binding protein